MSVLALCKFTPLGFETNLSRAAKLYGRGVNLPRWGLKRAISRSSMASFMTCKFTPLGFETISRPILAHILKCVNLPRWGLKPFASAFILFGLSVNLPRWGLKLYIFLFFFAQIALCKFTPLGFETPADNNNKVKLPCVNLPRWGLKRL